MRVPVYCWKKGGRLSILISSIGTIKESKRIWAQYRKGEALRTVEIGHQSITSRAEHRAKKKLPSPPSLYAESLPPTATAPCCDLVFGGEEFAGGCLFLWRCWGVKEIACLPWSKRSGMD